MRLLRYFAVIILLFVSLLGAVQAKTPNPYRVLGVRREATEDEIKKAFKKRSLKFHPDTSKDPRAKEKFEMVVNAYELLKDPERKRIYDLTGDDNPQQQGGGNPFGGFGFPGGFPGGFGINIEDLLRQQMGGGGGRQQGGGRTFTFTFGGGRPGQGMNFEF